MKKTFGVTIVLASVLLFAGFFVFNSNAQSAAFISSIAPTMGIEGSAINIFGSGMGNCAPLGSPACNVQFFDSAGLRSTISGTEVSNSQVSATVPVGTSGPGDFTVRIGSLTIYSNELPFLILNPGNYAKFISQTVPTRVTTGQTFQVSIRMRNLGQSTWTNSTFKLGSQNPQDNNNWGLTRVNLPVSTVAPGQYVTITFNVTAPAVAGTYNFQWQMLQESVAWFGDRTTNIAISVETPPFNGEPCGNRNLIGKSDIFWGNPPPIDQSQPSPRTYNNVNAQRGNTIRLSTEGEFAADPPRYPDCTGIPVKFQVFYENNLSNPIRVVSGQLTAGSQIIVGNFGSWQWYISWANDLYDGRYKMKLIELGGDPITSPISGNVLIMTGSGTAPPTPDYVAQGLSTSGNIVAGQQVNFSATIRNSGTAGSSSASTTRFSLDTNSTCSNFSQDVLLGSPQTSALAMGAGEVETLLNAWTAVAGNHCFRVCADVGGAIAELDENNNCSSQAFTVFSPPTVNILCNGSNACSIGYNSSANLSWTSTNSTSCSVTPGGWTGTSSTSQATGNLTTTTTYNISCTGPGGSANDSVVVTVAPPPPTASILCNGSSACSTPYNGSVNLSWTSTNSTSCSVTPGGWTGTSSTSQATGNLTTTTTYNLSCTGAGGTATDSVVVTVGSPPPTVNILCNGSNACSIGYNSSANLSWTSTNSTSCSVTPGGWTGTSSTSQATGNLTTTTTYNISCTGPGGSANDSVVVTVAPPPPTAANIQCNGSNACSIGYNSSANLSWTSSNADSCTVTPGSWTGTSSTSQATGNLTTTTTYNLSCTGAGGTATDSVVVTVAPPPPTADLRCNSTNACSIPYNTSATLSWTSTGATTCTVTPGSWTGTSGSESSGSLTTTTTYNLSCTGGGGTATDSVVVTVGPAPTPPPVPQASITCNGILDSCGVAYGGTANINWTCTNSTSGSVTNDGDSNTWTGPNGGQTTPVLTSGRTYTITCTGAGGSTTDTVYVGVGSAPTPEPPAAQGSVSPFRLTVLNPFGGNIDTLDNLFGAIIAFLYYIVGPIVVMMIVTAGLFFLFARGDADKINKGKKILTWAIVGLVIVLIGQGFTTLLQSIIDMGT